MKPITFLLLVVFATGRLSAGEIALKELLNHPKRHQGRRVTTVGLAIESGSGFYLFNNVQSAAALDTSRAVYVNDRPGQPVFVHKQSGYWFIVEGTVDALRHGPWGHCPAEIVSVNRRALRREAEPYARTNIGYFRNATDRRIYVEEQGNGGVCILQPGEEGSIDDLKSGTITVSDFSGEPYAKLFESKISLPPRHSSRNEPEERRFWFTVLKNRLIMEKK
jgi:hypothetical protein